MTWMIWGSRILRWAFPQKKVSRGVNYPKKSFNYPGKRPQTVWGGVLHYNCDDGHGDDDDDDDDDDGDGDGDDGDGEGHDGDDDDDDDEEEEDDDVEEDDVEEKDRSQDREAHFMGASAVEMRMDISQEPFCLEIYKENGWGHLRGQRFVRACAVEMHMDIWEEPFCVGIYTQKIRTPIPRQAFCASLRSRNAHGHFTRAISFWYLQEKNAARAGYHLDQTPGLTVTVRTPSVWPHCLGN